jgi:hypothetical protein
MGHTLGPVLFILANWIAFSLTGILLVVIFSRIHVEKEHHTGQNVTTTQDSSEHLRAGRVVNVVGLVVLLTLVLRVSLPYYSIKQSSESYAWAREDRPGAQIADMLFHHAYAHWKRARYGGACAGIGNSLTENQKQAQKMLKEIGLDGFLKFRCPPGGLDDPSMIPTYLLYLPVILNRWLLTQSWLKSIKSQISYPRKPPGTFKIVAHVRRGDISPCRGARVSHRYLSNSYYLEMIDRYTPPPSLNKTIEIVIHSQTDSFEPLSVFLERNYTMKMEATPLVDVWRDFMSADVLIMSKSSFSLTPAILNQDGVVVFAPYIWFTGKMPGWVMADRDVLRRSKQETLKLADAKCRKRERMEKSGVFYLLRHGAMKFFLPWR